MDPYPGKGLQRDSCNRDRNSLRNDAGYLARIYHIPAVGRPGIVVLVECTAAPALP